VTITRTCRFTIGVLLRGGIKRSLTKALDQLAATSEVTYDLKEYSGWLDSDFLLVLKGPEALVNTTMLKIQQYFVELEKED
jgi:hypothetical protein